MWRPILIKNARITGFMTLNVHAANRVALKALATVTTDTVSLQMENLKLKKFGTTM